jgi:hypothetical protein
MDGTVRGREPLVRDKGKVLRQICSGELPADCYTEFNRSFGIMVLAMVYAIVRSRIAGHWYGSSCGYLGFSPLFGGV